MSKIKRMITNSLMYNAFQDIAILRFFLKMQLLQKTPLQFTSAFNPSHSIQNALELNIEYESDDHDICDFFVHTPAEQQNIWIYAWTST